MAALPSLQKTWFYNINNKRAGSANLGYHQNLMFDIHRALIDDSPNVPWTDDTGSTASPAGIWTVDHSNGDGGLGTAGDGLDRWGSAASLLWDRPGDSHHWMVYNTGINAGAAQFVIDLDNGNNASAGSIPESIDCRINYAGNFAGGTALLAPVADPALTEITQGQVNGAWAGNQNQAGLDISWHMMMSSDGEELRVFMHRDNVCFAIWMVGVPASPPASSVTNMHAGIWSTVQQTPLECLNFTVASGWFNGGATATSEQNIISAVGDGVAFPANTVKITYPHMVAGGASQSMFKSVDLGGQADELEGEQVFAEIGLWAPDSIGNRGPKGRLKDMWLVKDDRQVGDTYPAAGTRLFHQIGPNMAVPWNGVIPENSF